MCLCYLDGRILTEETEMAETSEADRLAAEIRRHLADRPDSDLHIEALGMVVMSLVEKWVEALGREVRGESMAEQSDFP